MGLWDTITDTFEAAGDAISDAAESAYDTVASGAIGDAIAAGARAVDTATFGYAGRALHAADDYVFDTVDYVTGGAVNLDFDDGQFSVGAGFDGLAFVGASVGEAGVTYTSEVLGGLSYDIRMTDQGFLASGSAGIDWGPLPYAEGHVEMLPNGDVRVNGHVQGTLPTQVGLFSGQASGGFTSTSEGWGAYWDSDGTWRMPNGVTLRSAQQLSYMDTVDGSHLAVGLQGSVSYQGLGTVGAGVGYERVERDGDVVEGLHLEGHAEGLGMSARAEADYVHSDIGGVERSDWSGDADLDGPSLQDAARLASRVAASQVGGDDLGGAASGLAPADVPMDSFDAAIDAADTVEQSMDHLTQDFM